MDRMVCGEIKPQYGWMSLEGAVVLDVGACFGAFTSFAARCGAAWVRAYEPAPDNWSLLQANCGKTEGVNLRNAALVGDDRDQVSFFMSTSGKNPANYSTVAFRGRTEIVVKAENFQRVLEELHPDVVKIDCEGAEYELMPVGFRWPDCVKQVAMEIHFNKRRFRHTWRDHVVAPHEGWRTVRMPMETGSNWTTIGGWKR